MVTDRDTLAILKRIVRIANISAIEGDDGFVERYDMPVGPIHAAIAHLQACGIPVESVKFARTDEE